MSADDDRAVQVGESRVYPEGTATLIAGLDDLLAQLMGTDEPPTHRHGGLHATPSLPREEQFKALAIRAQLAAALAVEHAALELALTRELLEQVAERWDP